MAVLLIADQMTMLDNVPTEPGLPKLYVKAKIYK